jgi:hypothetical protein
MSFVCAFLHPALCSFYPIEFISEQKLMFDFFSEIEEAPSRSSEATT